MAASAERFIALDTHKQYIVVGGMNIRQEVVMHPHRVEVPQFEGWAHEHLRRTDAVVLESSSDSWHYCDLLEPLVARVVVANPYRVRLIAASLVNTDKISVLILARLLAADMIPPVWVPPPHVRELRSLVAHRARLVSQRSAAKNRLRALLHRYHIRPPAGDLFAASCRDWWAAAPLPGSETLVAQQNLALVEQLAAQIQQVESTLATRSATAPWGDQSAFLLQLPGVGLLSAMTLLGEIGDITRFASAHQLVGYAGLGARVRSSGQSHRSEGITKQSRRQLRATMIEVAWIAVRDHPYWQARYAYLVEQKHKEKQLAIVAIARRLLVVVWHVLTAQAADRRADTVAVARSLMTWASRYRLATSLGMSRPEFVRQELDRLGLGQAMTQFEYNGRICRLPPSKLVFALPMDVAASLLTDREEVSA
jgi:transposase